MADDVAVAGDVGGDDRYGGGEGLGEDHAEALAVQRGRAEHVGRGELGALLGVGDFAQGIDAAGVEQQRGDVVGAGADEGEGCGDVVAQGLEGAQEDGKALAFDGLADEEDPQGSTGDLAVGVCLAVGVSHTAGVPLAAGVCLAVRISLAVGVCLAGDRLARRGQHGRPSRAGPSKSIIPIPHGVVGDVHAVGHDAVVPAIEAPGGPGGGLGDGDASVQVVHAPPRAEGVADAVAQSVCGVAVKGADERDAARAAERVPADERRDGLVDVHDVIAPVAQLAAHARDGARPVGEVGDGAVGGPAERASQPDEIGGRLDGLRAHAVVKAPREGVVGVPGREHAGLVAGRGELGGERLDVASDAAGVGPRVRRDECDAHV